MKVAVGSLNPVKIDAVKQAFNQVWPKATWLVTGVAVPSGVSGQPMSDQEAISGARERARRACSQLVADYGVGLEGGVEHIGRHWFDCGWIIVHRHDGVEGVGSTARIIVPPPMIKLLKTGKELGEIIDIFFKTVNAKQGQGHFGLMTNQAITRTSGYRDGVIMALARFLHPELWMYNRRI